MRRILSFFDRHRMRYVGAAVGYSITRDKEGKEKYVHQAVWILQENLAGKRSSKKVGDAGNSQLANSVEARVKAWLMGGPLPDLDPKYRLGHPRGKLLMIEGGKAS